MRVAELIEWLRQQPQDNEVLLCDPDTGWWLPLHTSGFAHEEQPAASTAVFASYDDKTGTAEE